MTAVPQPPKVSQNVPISSATYFFAISLLMRKSLRGARSISLFKSEPQCSTH